MLSKFGKIPGFYLLILVLFLLSISISDSPIVFADSNIRFIEENDLLKISNKHFEIGFARNNGGILYIKDSYTGQNVSEGNNREILWWAFLANGDWIDSTFYQNNFSYNWSSGSNKLTMSYLMSDEEQLEVIIELFFQADNWFKMKAEVRNETSKAIQEFGFPYQLGLEQESIKNALIPMLPGVKLVNSFFEDSQSYTAQYPGVIFADFLAISSKKGRMAIYGQHNSFLQPAIIGYEKFNQGNSYRIIHNYKTWIQPGMEWCSPTVYVRIGEGYRDSIKAYREDSGIAKFPDLASKLGENKQQFFEAPLYKLDMELIGYDCNKIKSSIIDTIDIPGMVHPVAFQRGGHDLNYPDFLPPAAELGDINEFTDLVEYTKSRGNLVIPYTNFSWWDTDGPTLANLPVGIDVDDLTVLNNRGIKMIENYGPGKNGYVMNLHNSFVRERIATEHKKLIDIAKMDGIFEDQWGTRSAPYDFNPAGLELYDPSVSYFQGVLAHTARHAENNLMTEIGVDMLAEHEVGFMGTNFLWDKLGYREATAKYSQYYPMAGILLRDKVLFYQHDLAEETWTNNLDMFRWNLAMGYNFSNAFYVNGGLYTENPWLDLVGVFQKYVLSRYAGQLIKDYRDIGNNVFKTEFEDYMVYTNWNKVNTFTINNHTVPAGGAIVLADDGSVTAGIFKSYNQRLLSEGEHYLVVLREEDRIRIFQPVGPDTLLSIRKYRDWIGAEVKAYQYDGTYIADVEAAAEGDNIVFNYQKEVLSREVGYYEIIESETPDLYLEGVEYKPDLVIKDILWTPDDPSAGSELSFRIVVENQGTGATEEGVIPEVSLNVDAGKSSFWSRNYTDTIAPGEVITMDITTGTEKKTWTAEEGEHVLYAVIDDYNKIEESNEENNYYVKLLPLIKKSVVEAATIEPVKKGIYALKQDLCGIDFEEAEILFERYASHKINKPVVGSFETEVDISGSFGLLWDNEYLYLLADIRDDHKNMNKGQSIWQNDCVELYLDMNNNGGTTYMKDDFQFMFGWNSERVYETKHNSTDGVSMNTIDTDYGYRIFAEIPWTTLGVTPENKLDFGVDVAIDDNDSGTRDTQLIWNSNDDQAWQYPDRFGTGQLVIEEKADLRIAGLSWQPEEASAGEKIKFNVILTNQGTAATPDGLFPKIKFYVNGEGPIFWCDDFASTLEPGESVVLTVNDGIDGELWTLETGEFKITAIIDEGHKLDELSETNNSFQRIIKIK
jgi:hypothetical protein